MCGGGVAVDFLLRDKQVVAFVVQSRCGCVRHLRLKISQKVIVSTFVKWIYYGNLV